MGQQTAYEPANSRFPRDAWMKKLSSCIERVMSFFSTPGSSTSRGRVSCFSSGITQIAGDLMILSAVVPILPFTRDGRWVIFNLPFPR